MAIEYGSTSTKDETGATSDTTLTWSHTCESDDNKLVVACGGRQSISGVTYNGVAMTLASSVNESYEYNAIYYLDNPATGSAHDIVVTYSSSSAYRMGVACGIKNVLSGVGDTDADIYFYVATTPVTATASITTTKNNAHALTFYWENSVNSGSTTYESGQTGVVKNTNATSGFTVRYKLKETAGAISSTISNSTPFNVAVQLIEIQPSVGNPSAFFQFFN